jgi:hypothetical protein
VVGSSYPVTLPGVLSFFCFGSAIRIAGYGWQAANGGSLKVGSELSRKIRYVICYGISSFWCLFRRKSLIFRHYG